MYLDILTLGWMHLAQCLHPNRKKCYFTFCRTFFFLKKVKILIQIFSEPTVLYKGIDFHYEHMKIKPKIRQHRKRNFVKFAMFAKFQCLSFELQVAETMAFFSNVSHRKLFIFVGTSLNFEVSEKYFKLVHIFQKVC